MKSKWFALLILILTVALLASACKKNPDSGETPDQPAVPEGLNFAPVEEGSIFYLVEGPHYEGEELVIPTVTPDGNLITQIGSFGFVNHTNLKKVTIPPTIEVINGSAFEGCTGLTEIEIPSSVEGIAMYAFENCTGLKKVTLSKALFSIGSEVFKGCTALTDIFYDGTQEDWNSGLKHWKSTWLEADHPVTVHCTDGNIVLDE